MIFEHSGFALIGVKPADPAAQILELNEKKEDNVPMNETEIKNLIKQTVDEFNASHVAEINQLKDEYDKKINELNEALATKTTEVNEITATSVQIQEALDKCREDLVAKNKELDALWDERNALEKALGEAKAKERIGEKAKADAEAAKVVAEQNSAMVYVTGDCHADWRKFSVDSFPEQAKMTRDDFVIVCGDFGLWHDNKAERWWFKWFTEKNFTLLFVDGNHENFDRLYGDEFEIVDFHGGKAHKISDNIYHLMRGYIFDLCGKQFFAFGGASSHDIQDGILNPEDYPSTHAVEEVRRRLMARGKFVRINHIDWWEQELPTQEEMDFGLDTLSKNGNKVDFIITHCCPQEIASSAGFPEPDVLTRYFNTVAEKVQFDKWFFGHYHDDRQIMDKYIMLFDQIVRIL